MMEFSYDEITKALEAEIMKCFKMAHAVAEHDSLAEGIEHQAVGMLKFWEELCAQHPKFDADFERLSDLVESNTKPRQFVPYA